MRVHHKNLTSLVGYSNEGTKGLYELVFVGFGYCIRVKTTIKYLIQFYLFFIEKKGYIWQDFY